jgi:hypothetical protein
MGSSHLESGFTARSVYTAVLQARHAVVRRGDGPDWQLDAPTQSLLGKKRDYWRARTATGLLNPTWDDMPPPDAEVAALLDAVLTRASADVSPSGEREIRHRFIKALDQDDALALSSGASDLVVDTLLAGFEDRIEWVLRQLESDQRAVAIAHTSDTDMTWTQAACRAGVPALEAERMGEQVRRRLKYLRGEYNRRQQ